MDDGDPLLTELDLNHDLSKIIPAIRSEQDLDCISNRYFRRAFKLVLEHPFRSDVLSLHACVIVRGGSILSEGINTPIRSSYVMRFGPHPNCSVHAETAALLRGRNRGVDLRGGVAYIVRLRKKDSAIAMSRPCSFCQETLRKFGIRRVKYSTLGGFMAESVSKFS
jgi:deoxycytidylate deaminase